ncbi:tetrahydrofolate dehydrogenase/cyclohydrolase catalytic domain-containing protein, partial [Paracoccus versutus]
NKAVQTREAGMASFEHRLAAETPQAALLALVARLNADPAVHGILVQLPLPAHMDAGAVIAAIDPRKDV